MLTDASGEERKGIEVEVFDGWFVIPLGINTEDVANMYSRKARWLAKALITIRDLMLAGF